MKCPNCENGRLVALLQEYIDILCEELDELVPIGEVHGWKSTRVEKGIDIRTKIFKEMELQE